MKKILVAAAVMACFGTAGAAEDITVDVAVIGAGWCRLVRRRSGSRTRRQRRRSGKRWPWSAAIRSVPRAV